MKKIKNIFILFLAFFLIASVIPSAQVSAADADMRYGRTILAQMDNAEGLLYIYDRLVEGCLNAEESISVANDTYPVKWDDVRTIYRAFHSDYPEYFWVKNSYSGTIGSATRHVKTIKPSYFITGSELDAAKVKFNKKVDELTAGLSGKSDYEKSLILHDRLAKNAVYLHSENNQNAYGSLVDGEAVCAGYSKGYQHLLNKVGIPAWAVIGESVSPSTETSVAHEWTMVKLDGEWYFSDVTWDDQGERIYYSCLNMTTAIMEEDHVVINFKEYLPKATSTEANYFYKNNLVYSSFDADALANNLKANKNVARFFIAGNIEEYISDVHENIRTVATKAGIPNDKQYSYMMYRLGREVFLTVNVIDAAHTHKLTAVAAKTPTCQSKGSKAYYSCSCGKWFSDSAGEKEITNKDSLVLSAIAHTPSGWKNDDTNHWKECKTCHIEIAGSRASHIDSDKNGKCDTCSKGLAVVGSGTEAPPTSSQTAPPSSTPVSSEEVPSQNSPSSTPVSSEEMPNTETIITEEDVPFELDTKLIYTIAGAGGAVIVLAAVLIFVFVKRK